MTQRSSFESCCHVCQNISEFCFGTPGSI